ncbi:MAG: RSP_7527 family protein [Bradyrhizobium sp.]
MAFYKRRAKQLRDEAYRNMWRGLWARIRRMGRVQRNPSPQRDSR